MRRLPPLLCPEMHFLANTCQVVAGLQPHDAVLALFDPLKGPARAIDATNLAPLPRDCCRRMVIDTFLQLSERDILRDPEWPRHVRSALIAERPLAGAVSELLSRMPAVPASRPHPLTARLLTMIERRHADHDLKERDLARALKISTNTVGRALQRGTGTNFRSLLREARLRHASELLRESDLSVKQIAWAVGYKHSSQFSRDFAHSRRRSPSDYRRGLLQFRAVQP